MNVRQRIVRASLAATATLALWIGFLFVLAAGGGPVTPAPERLDSIDCAPELTTLAGNGEQHAEGHRVTALDSTASAFILCQVPAAEAGRLPVLRLQIDDFPPNYVLMLAWRTKAMSDAQFVRLQVPRGRVQTYHLGGEPGWAGALQELALYLYPQEPAGSDWVLTRPIRIRSLGLTPDSMVARINAMGTSWFGVDPWNHRALNTLGEHHGQLELHRLNPALAALWLIAVAVFGICLARGRRQWLMVPVFAAAGPALIAYGHWLDSLAWQRHATAQIFGELSPQERQLRQYDGDLVRLALEARALIGDDRSRRVYVSAPDAVTAIRGAYHLRPLNVSPSVPAPQAVRAGDLILIYEQPDRMRDAAQGRYRRGRANLRVQPVYQESFGMLVRIEK